MSKLNNQLHLEQEKPINFQSRDNKSLESSQNDQDNPGNFIERGKDMIKNFKNEAKDKLEEAVDQVKDKSSETQAALGNYIKKHPIFSLGCAALAGVVLAAILRR